MHKKIIIGLSIVMGIISIVLILNSFSADEIFTPFAKASLLAVLGFTIVSFLISVFQTLRWHFINKTMGIIIPFWDLYLYRLAGYCISYVTPGPRVGGEPVMATLLKKRGVDYMKSLSGMVVDKTLDAAMSGTVFILGVLVLFVGVALPEDTKNLMILVAVIFGGLIVFFYYRMLNGKEVLVSSLRFLRLNKIKFIKNAERKLLAFEKLIVRFHHREKKTFLITVIIGVFLTLLMYFEYTFALGILGLKLSILEIYLVIAFTGAATLLPIPGAIGSMEAGQISALSMSGEASASGFSLALIIRARDFIWVLLGFLLLFYFGFDLKKLMKKISKKYVRVNKNVKIYLRD